MRALLFETRTGKPVDDLERSAWDYDTGILAADKAEITVPAYTPRARSMDLDELLTPYKYSVALVDESVDGSRLVPAAGPITSREPEDDADGRPGFKLTVRGVETLLGYRYVRKYPGWPLLNGVGEPTGTYDMRMTGLSLGTIVKRLVEESEKYPGGNLPIIYEPDRGGAHDRLYEAVEGKPVLEAIDDIADLDDGVEYDFRPVIDETDNLSYVLVTGTDSGKSIVGSDALTWNLGGEAPDIRGWAPNDRPGELATHAIYHGGKGNDKVMLAQASDSTLINEGWPRLEAWESVHSTEVEQATLQAWANGRVQSAHQRPQLEVRADRAHGVRHGDLVEIAAQGHWLVPDGETRRRVLSVSRDSKSPDWVGVQLV